MGNTQSSCNRSLRSRADAVVSAVRGVFGIVADVSSDFPIPALGYAFSVLESIMERIEKMRANSQDAKEAVESIKALRKTLRTSSNSIGRYSRQLQPGEREVAADILDSSHQMRDRIESLCDRLGSIQDLAEDLPSRGRLSRLIYTEQDADLLKRIKSEVKEATENFRLKGDIAVEDILRDMRANLQDMAREGRIQSCHEQLSQLDPADASYRSEYTSEKARLQPGTRESVLADLRNWATHPNPPCRVFVLHGQAGMGKSSIVHALTEQIDKKHYGGSFFFNRGIDECRDAHRVFPTLAHQLAHSRDNLVYLIATSAREHIAQGRKQALKHQLEELIINPLRRLSNYKIPILLALDGVDECANTENDAVPRMLQLLCQAAADIPCLRILIATRPERHILNALHSSDNSSLIVWRDLQKEPDVDRDIRLLIDSEFEKCRKAGPFPLLEKRPDAAQRLTDLSDGLFIYAITILRVLTRDKHFAVQMYDLLLESQGRLGPGKAYEKLDMLYGVILTSAFDELKGDQHRMGCILQTLCWMTLCQWDTLPKALSLSLLGIQVPITLDFIERLRSVLIVDDTVTPSTPIRACHASFPQFLMDPARCTDPAFLVDPPSGHALIAISLIDLLARDDVDSLRGADGDMPPMWDYARRQWDDHLVEAQYTPELGRSLRHFVETHLEDWLRSVEPWGVSRWSKVAVTNACAGVLGWYKEHGSDDGLVAMLDAILDGRVKEIAAKVNESPAEFDWTDFERIKAWVMDRYPRETQQASVSDRGQTSSSSAFI
ncbi:hypothetical protein CERSUDRAFT_114603 [Gelatoporia subvermispora B]|uniref:NACHT domain-containing protein n=1 Tax=Ceriporiopsis subvermispora (strain B) TaxID=914234 RepID=M2RCX9_CERS8|nr:hypothetical protein CERSUDRAFT_114603 [Gelatoporia subvermispora B]